MADDATVVGAMSQEDVLPPAAESLKAMTPRAAEEPPAHPDDTLDIDRPSTPRPTSATATPRAERDASATHGYDENESLMPEAHDPGANRCVETGYSVWRCLTDVRHQSLTSTSSPTQKTLLVERAPIMPPTGWFPTECTHFCQDILPPSPCSGRGLSGRVSAQTPHLVQVEGWEGGVESMKGGGACTWSVVCETRAQGCRSVAAL